MKNSKYAHLKIVYNRSKLGWYWSPLFVAFWFVLFYVTVTQSFYYLTDILRQHDELKNPGRFIGENAESLLLKLTKIGPRVVGSPGNEQAAVHMLLSEIGRIKQDARLDLYDVEHEVQVASGNFYIFNMINFYHSIQNIIVKVTPKNTTSNAILLINSHYDSVPGSPGAGDAGLMVVTMLETLRVICKYETALKHSIVFLFNGAEENPLQGSHAFITQHKWAKNVSAFINLDSAGSGGREMLFQTGPAHSWLVKYYGANAMHYFASTLAEEIFQRGLVPSDTDFRIFRDFGKIPGLDLASIANGYVYHTKFDRFNIIPRNSYQSTGDNVLALTKALANAPELENLNSTHLNRDHMIFYDVLGWFFIYYSETTALIVNIVVCVLALITIVAYIWNMAQQTGMFRRRIFMKFSILFGIQLVTIIATVLVTLALAFFMDLIGLSLSWYSQKWMIFGLYFCPIYFVMGIIPAFYLSRTKEHGLPLGYAIQLIMHSHCVLLIIVAILMISFNIRSVFLIIISIAFYTLSVILNIATCFHNKTFLWLIPHCVCQLMPFVFFTYNCYLFFEAIVPMQGRAGVNAYPELIIAAFTVLMSLLFAGFLIPLFWLFRKSKTIITCFAVICVSFIILAATPLGFPFAEKLAAQRFYALHTTRTFHNADPRMSVNRTDAGFFVLPVDKRGDAVLPILAAQNYTTTAANCSTELYCGYPIYERSWPKYISSGYWLPGPSPHKNGWPTLQILAKQRTSLRNILYTLEVSGPDHMTIIIQPTADSRLLDWSFDREALQKQSKPPFLIRFSFGLELPKQRFNLEFERTISNWTGPSFEIAIVGHKLHNDIFNTEDFREFLASFPPWTYVSAWASSYESWRL